MSKTLLKLSSLRDYCSIDWIVCIVGEGRGDWGSVDARMIKDVGKLSRLNMDCMGLKEREEGTGESCDVRMMRKDI